MQTAKNYWTGLFRFNVDTQCTYNKTQITALILNFSPYSMALVADVAATAVADDDAGCVLPLLCRISCSL